MNLRRVRALSHRPGILCLDEFSIASDPVTTMRIEEVLRELRYELSIMLVTNLTQQAKRLADRTMFLPTGEIVELADNGVIFSPTPADRRTYDCVNGRIRMNAIKTRNLSLWYGATPSRTNLT